MSQRVVLKFGSGILTCSDRLELDPDQLERLVDAVAGLHHSGYECIVVSSGAVAAGLPAFDLKARPTDLASLQACAAVGQTRLMHYYETLFRRYKLNVGQMLLSHEDLRTPQRQHNFCNTLERLLAFRNTIPVINENDSVAVEELRYGDNDLLSADVARLAKAKQLVLLTTVDGLLPPGKTDGNDILREVPNIEDVLAFATTERGLLSVGGMASKLRAVQRSVDAGIETFIANGYRPEQIKDLLEGRGHGTHFGISPEPYDALGIAPVKLVKGHSSHVCAPELLL